MLVSAFTKSQPIGFCIVADNEEIDLSKLIAQRRLVGVLTQPRLAEKIISQAQLSGSKDIRWSYPIIYVNAFH
jgi:hypothetical protein